MQNVIVYRFVMISNIDYYKVFPYFKMLLNKKL